MSIDFRNVTLTLTTGLSMLTYEGKSVGGVQNIHHLSVTFFTTFKNVANFANFKSTTKRKTR